MIRTAGKNERKDHALKSSAGCEPEGAVGEFVKAIHVLLTSMAEMCARLHVPDAEPLNPAQARVLAIVERALRDALAAVDRVGNEFDSRSIK